MLKFFGSKKQAALTAEKQRKPAATADATANTTSADTSISKITPEKEIASPQEEYLQFGIDGEAKDLTLFKEALNYVVARTSPSSISDIEVLHLINVPKEFVINKEKEKIETIKDDVNDKNEKVEALSGEVEPILHAIYSKQLIRSNNSPLYQCNLKQVYNDYVIGEAKRISLVGEPIITINTPQFETKLCRTSVLSNTWHFDFEGRDYRWKPTLFGSKDSDLICELIEYKISPIFGGGAGKKKKKEIVATLKRKGESWDMIGDLCILENAWQDVKNHRALEIILVIGCLIMLDIIKNS